MKYIKLYEDFQMGDLNFMSPHEIITLFFGECGKEVPNLELIKVILDNGLVDVDARGFMGMTPLHYVIRNGNVSIAKCLISAGAKVNAKDKFGQSLLHYAVEWDSVEIAEYLISAGANVNAKNNIGTSPLSVAVSKGYEEMQALLKKHGAVE